MNSIHCITTVLGVCKLYTTSIYLSVKACLAWYIHHHAITLHRLRAWLSCYINPRDSTLHYLVYLGKHVTLTPRNITLQYRLLNLLCASQSQAKLRISWDWRKEISMHKITVNLYWWGKVGGGREYTLFIFKTTLLTELNKIFDW